MEYSKHIEFHLKNGIPFMKVLIKNGTYFRNFCFRKNTYFDVLFIMKNEESAYEEFKEFLRYETWWVEGKKVRVFSEEDIEKILDMYKKYIVKENQYVIYKVGEEIKL